MVAVFRDRSGLLAWVDYGPFSALCAYDGSDRLIGATTARRLSAFPGYLPGTGPPASVEQVVARQPSVWVIGSTRRGVARLEATWPGVPTVTVPVWGPYWVARVTLPAGGNPSVPPALVAYDAAGNRVR